ncbi:GntR family transcriptional regulator [Cupriavidus basilensis]|uniref:GntR family transcriptional regulator n=1 Tax=Cupriavidus basilensis TaxID=68895 RepID=UPI0028529AAA|nr:GntR family transcriptional regulator [Cupriavidus basilensis]
MKPPAPLAMPKLNFSAIARDLTQGIRSGHFPVGSLLPTELELVAHDGTSRHTVRTALASVENLMQFGAAHLRVVQAIEEVRMSGAQAKELGCASGARWLRISACAGTAMPTRRPSAGPMCISTQPMRRSARSSAHRLAS